MANFTFILKRNYWDNILMRWSDYCYNYFDESYELSYRFPPSLIFVSRFLWLITFIVAFNIHLFTAKVERIENADQGKKMLIDNYGEQADIDGSVINRNRPEQKMALLSGIFDNDLIKPQKSLSDLLELSRYTQEGRNYKRRETISYEWMSCYKTENFCMKPLNFKGVV